MGSNGSIVTAQISKYKIMISQKGDLFYVKHIKNVKFLSGSRGPHGPDLPSPCGRKFQFFSTFILWWGSSFRSLFSCSVSFVLPFVLTLSNPSSQFLNGGSFGPSQSLRKETDKERQQKFSFHEYINTIFNIILTVYNIVISNYLKV